MKFSIKDKSLFLDDSPLLLDNIQVIKPLGHGENAHVFKVYNTETKRHEALKVWHPEVNGDKLRTAVKNAVGHFNSSGLAAVYAAGNVNNQYYNLMEYIDGVSLENFLTKEPPFPRRAFYLEQTLQALRDIYQRGTFHSEIRSDNILIDDVNEKAFLIDLGSSRFLKKGPSHQKNAKLLIGLCLEVLPELANPLVKQRALAQKKELPIIEIMMLHIDLLKAIKSRKPETWDQYSLIQDIVLKIDALNVAYAKEHIAFDTATVDAFLNKTGFPKEKIDILKSWYRKIATNTQKF